MNIKLISAVFFRAIADWIDPPPSRKPYGYKSTQQLNIDKVISTNDWLTARQIAALSGSDYRTAHRYLYKLLNKGIVERRRFAAVSGGDKYRLLPDKSL